MNTVIGWATANGSGGASVDGEFEAADRAGDATVVKTVPIIGDNRGKFGEECRGEVGRNRDDFVEFSLVAGGVPEVKIIARWEIFACGGAA